MPIAEIVKTIGNIVVCTAIQYDKKHSWELKSFYFRVKCFQEIHFVCIQCDVWKK